jgi:hypothetical protein
MPAKAGMPFQLYQAKTLDNRYVGGGRSFRPLDDLKGDPVTFVERPKSRCIDTAMMDKHVRPIFLLNESVAFAAVKPLYYAVYHAGTLLSK